jgi:zinc transporter ZupT
LFGEEAAIVTGAAAMSAAGVGFALLAAATARRVTDYIGLFAGVVLLLVAAFHLAPEALSGGQGALMFLVGGAAVGLGVEVLFRTRRHPDGPRAIKLAATLALIVLAIHSTLDGAVYTATFWKNPDSGFLASLGLILHEAPEGVVAMALALQLGLRPAIAAGLAIIASSLTTPLGWALAHGLGDHADGSMSVLFAASAGLLLFVGGHLVFAGWHALRNSGAGSNKTDA